MYFHSPKLLSTYVSDGPINDNSVLVWVFVGDVNFGIRYHLTKVYHYLWRDEAYLVKTVLW